MGTEMGELLVGAYLAEVEGCDHVGYNARFRQSSISGLHELDVVGFDFDRSTAFLCEVTTHLSGALYVKSGRNGNEYTVERILAKHEAQKRYAKEYLRSFDQVRFQYWSPYVPEGYITEKLSKVRKLEVIVNGEYTTRIHGLRDAATSKTKMTGNDAFRLLQIMGHLRPTPG